MGNQDWSNLGEQIRNSVQSAIDNQNFRQLNETIRNTVNSAMDMANQSLNQANQRFNHGGAEYYGPHSHVEPRNSWDSGRNREKDRGRNRDRSRDGYLYRDSPAKNNFKGEIIPKNGLMKGAGYSLAITGCIFAGGLGIAIFTLLLLCVFMGILPGFKIAIGVMLPLLIGSGLMAWKGSRILGRLKRFRQYARQLQGQEFCPIKELAGAVGKSVQFTVKDLRNMIRKNMFPQGHIDVQETCLMVTDKIYDQYRQAQRQMESRQREEQSRLKDKRQEKKEDKKEERASSGMPEEVRKVIGEGRTYIEKIKKSNDAIPGIEVSEKISRLEVITSKIFERVEQHPENIPDLRKFMEYYLPTTVKLLDAYEELDRQPVQGENIRSAKREIEDTLDTINMAFEKLLDGFFQDTSWDISSDISVLQTMFAQEGLTGSAFKREDGSGDAGDDGKEDINLKF